MLTLIIGGDELFDEKEQTFQDLEDEVLTLEHSLVSLSKWESKFEKPFLGPGEKTSEEIFEYIKLMILTPFYDVNIFDRFTQEHLNQINDYIDSPQSATTFNSLQSRSGPSEIITAELIYYWLVAFQIPFECENWHLNRLFALIRICNIKNSPPKKMPKSEIAQRNRELNAQRREQMGTKG